jgi:hypothetical protein
LEARRATYSTEPRPRKSMISLSENPKLLKDFVGVRGKFGHQEHVDELVASAGECGGRQQSIRLCQRQQCGPQSLWL